VLKSAKTPKAYLIWQEPPVVAAELWWRRTIQSSSPVSTEQETTPAVIWIKCAVKRKVELLDGEAGHYDVSEHSWPLHV